MGNLHKILRKLRLIDGICIIYCLFMIAVISLFGYKLPDQALILAVYAGCIAVSIIFIYLRKYNNPALNYFSAIYPLILLIPFYEISGHQIHLFFNGFFDNYLLAFENAIFPVHPIIWFERLYHPLLTEWMMMGYSLYLFLIPITTSWLYFTGKKSEAQDMQTSLLIALFSCYIMFSLFPVTGPRFAMVDQFGPPLEGFIFRAFTASLESNAMLHGGAFPSAHCAAATVMLILSYKYDRKLFKWITTILITLYISTVYGRYHYPVDVVAGILVGIASIKLSYPIRRLWQRLSGTNAKF